jgi:hypothetical protein
MARLGQGPVRLRVLTSVALMSSAAVLVTAVWAADRHPSGDPTLGDVTRVGVVEGQSIPGYVRSTRAELAALLAEPASGSAPDTYALVTMSAYLAPGRLAPVLGGVRVSEVFSRVPLPDTQTQIVRIPALRVPEDVVAGMAQVAERKDREAQDYHDRSAALAEGGSKERELRRLYDSGVNIALAEATAYRAHCSCLYAAVVRAAPPALQKMASRPEVRAVDPAPEVQRLDRTVFSPPLPEQEDVVRPPADANLPADGGAATASPSGSAPGQPPITEPSPSPAPTPGATSSPPPPHETPSAPPSHTSRSPDAPQTVPSSAAPLTTFSGGSATATGAAQPAAYPRPDRSAAVP